MDPLDVDHLNGGTLIDIRLRLMFDMSASGRTLVSCLCSLWQAVKCLWYAVLCHIFQLPHNSASKSNNTLTHMHACTHAHTVLDLMFELLSLLMLKTKVPGTGQFLILSDFPPVDHFSRFLFLSVLNV